MEKKFDLFPAEELTNEKGKFQPRRSKGLSELTRKCFGAPLNKSECVSFFYNKLNHIFRELNMISAIELGQTATANGTTQIWSS